MASSIQRRRGTTSDHSTFTGAVGEITIDTTKDTVVVHDGAVVGGVPLLREDGSNSSLALGSQGVPSLKFSGDPNTGIYSPGADQLAVATNGTGKLFVAATGKIGINTAPPAGNEGLYLLVSSPTADTAGLQVKNGANATLELLLTGATYNYANIGANETWLRSSKAGAGANLNIGCDEAAAVKFITNALERARIRSDGTFEIKCAGTAGTSPGFSVNPSTPADSFVIDSSGRLGIGTSSPGSFNSFANNLVVGTGTGTNGITIYAGNASTSTLNFADGTSGNDLFPGYIIYNHADDSLSFIVNYAGNSSARMFISSAGCVGIGTTPASGTTLHVDATGGATVRVSRISASAGAYGQLEHDGTNTTLTSTAATAFVNNGTEKARIRSDGMFEVKGAGVSGSSPAFSVNGSAPANSAIIDTSGRLLVGTLTARSNFFNTASSAPQQLQVEGLTGNTCSLSSICSAADTSGGRLLLAHQRSGAVNGNTILNSGDETGVITFQGNDGGEFVESASISAQVDGTAAITAGSFVISRRYKIATVGTTNFTDIGASANTVGVIFTATGVGAGTGAATSEPYANSMPGRLVFSTTADGGTSPTERMRITSGGLVGIGTISPSADGPLTLTNSATTPTIFFERESTNYNGAIQCTAFGTITFYNGADSSVVSGLTPRMTIDGQYGRVGIGTTPQAKLHVNTGTNENLYVGSLGGSGAGVYLASVNDSGSSNQPLQIGSASIINFAINGVIKTTIDTSGRLLVGTTSDANGGQVEAKTAMVVSGNPAYDKKAFIAQIPYATTNITSSLLAGFDGNIHGVDLGYRYNGTGYDLCFATNSTTSGSPTERMRIKSDGSVNAKSFISNNQNAELLGYAYGSNGAFIDLSSITASNFTILEIFGSVNPNAAGASYIDPIHMYVYHGYGWNGSQLTSYIYSRHVAPIRTSDIFPSGGTSGNVCDAVWYNGSVESDSCIAGSGSHNVRLKITNWATSVGSSFNVRVFKRL